MRRGKNLIGAIHQPSLVVVDRSAFATLPRRELVSGYGEMIKYGLALDASLWTELLAVDPAAVADAQIERCVALKAAIVAADERDENGIRETLNFGHTIGHAIEAATVVRLLPARRGGRGRHARRGRSVGRCARHCTDALAARPRRATRARAGAARCRRSTRRRSSRRSPGTKNARPAGPRASSCCARSARPSTIRGSTARRSPPLLHSWERRLLLDRRRSCSGGARAAGTVV